MKTLSQLELERLTESVNVLVKVYRKIDRVKVFYGGAETEWNEEQVRAFQVYVNKCSDKEWERIKRSVTIYAGPSRRKMELLRNGCFMNDFDDGFYTPSSRMAIEIL